MRDFLQSWLDSERPGSTLEKVWELGGGVASRMTAFTVTNAGASTTLILRQPNDWRLGQCPNAVSDEFARLRALGAHGIPVPEPIFADAEGVHFDRPGLIIEYVEGAPDLSPRDAGDYVEQFARRLVDIHRCDPDDPGLRVSNPTSLPFTSYATSAPPKGDPQLGAERVHAYLREHASATVRNRPTFLHGDFWPGNTVWREDKLVAVIDWEEAKAGDPLEDLSISRLDLWWVLGRDAMDAFTTHYLALNPIDTSHLPLWDLTTALRPIGEFDRWAAAYGPLGRPDLTADHMRGKYREFVTLALAGLD